MDPLSITLAVITLATALKDIIDIAQDIHDSFSKLPQNYRNAQRLATLMLKTLREIQDIYQENTAVFDRTSHLRKATDDLRDIYVLPSHKLPSTFNREIRYAHKQCMHLIPPISEKSLVKLKFAVYSFLTRKKVEELLSDLNEHVNRCSQQFLVSSTGYNPMFKLLEVIDPYIPDAIPTHELSKAYLRREIGRVLQSLSLIMQHWVKNPPTSVEVPRLALTWLLQASLVSDTINHQDTLIIAFRTQSLLRAHPSSLCIKEIDVALNRLSVRLKNLDMTGDAISICNIRIQLWRAIVKLQHSRTSLRRLANALAMLAIVYADGGDKDRAFYTAAESTEILQCLVTEENLQEQFAMQDTTLLVRNMILQAESDPSVENSLKLAVDARKTLECALGISSKDDLNISSPSSQQTLKGSSDDHSFTYASLLFRIARVKLNSNSLIEAKESAKSALQALNHLHTKYPNSEKITDKITGVLALLSDRDIRPINTSHEILDYTERNIILLRQMCQITPQRYILRLVNSLWWRREAFVDIGKVFEAQQVYQELSNLGELAATPPHLSLKIPSEIEGDYYVKLASSHYLTDHFTDAIVAARKAISLYAALEPMDSSPCRSQAKLLTAARRYDAALSEGYKALNIIDNSNIRGPDDVLIVPHQEVLGALLETLEASPDPRSLEQANIIVTRIRKLAHSGRVKQQRKWDWALPKYAMLLQRAGRLEEAATYLQEITNSFAEIN
ncbi:hypothetical protein BDN70DRAFT_978724 [Pholiota conissans]|uniref:Fungal N-terminal domain-containing protein n=1 Tax=Pholiota conissans TaxID=109636 RepID=A0A9P5Z3R5_9AGAR|nr:hypothetical protein BDN70DRAFT_978724 [Pholiota conissans]